MEIFIHIGHGKTGTSAIQSFLAKNKKSLASLGLEYPDHESLRHASQGKVSSGNGLLLLDNFNFDSKSCNYLFSSELLFDKLHNKSRLKSTVERLPVQPVFICYTRNLYDYYQSEWGQKVKRHGNIKNIDEYAQDFKGPYSQLANQIIWAEELGYKFIVKNYSNHSENLIEHFIDIILQDADILPSTLNFDVGSVNRSLTEAEYKIQQLFNKNFDQRSSSFISDKLVNNIPTLETSSIKINKDAYELIQKNTIKDIEFINSKIESSEAIIFNDLEKLSYQDKNSQLKSYCFNEEQLNVIVEGITSKWKSFEKKK